MIWCTGMMFSIIAAGKAGYAISYGLGQEPPWWRHSGGLYLKEFKGSKGTSGMLIAMFALFLAGLALVIYAGTVG